MNGRMADENALDILNEAFSLDDFLNFDDEMREAIKLAVAALAEKVAKNGGGE